MLYFLQMLVQAPSKRRCRHTEDAVPIFLACKLCHWIVGRALSEFCSTAQQFYLHIPARPSFTCLWFLASAYPIYLKSFVLATTYIHNIRD